MNEQISSDVRKRSPRAPSFSLKEALERALILYEKEGRHPVALDVAAQDLGYKDAKSGAAKTALATLRQFGLIIRPTEGQVTVTKDVETYKFAPSEIERMAVLLKWLRIPIVYQHLLAKYKDRLPSDAQLRFELIQQGFSPQASEDQVQIFKESVSYAKFFEQQESSTETAIDNDADDDVDEETESATTPSKSFSNQPAFVSSTRKAPGSVTTHAYAETAEKIPIRLSGGRRAYLLLPNPFFELDKTMIKKQIDLILTDEEETTALKGNSENEL